MIWALNSKEPEPAPKPDKHSNGLYYYGRRDVCPKCGVNANRFVGGDVVLEAGASTHLQEVDTTQDKDNDGPYFTGTFLKRVCSRCGYWWLEMPLDERSKEK